MAQVQPKDWREKYLDLVEVQESEQQQFDEQLELLRRALVRVSLAADGVDPELDLVLAALREHLKSPEKHNLLHKRLKVVEEAIIAFDERKTSQLTRLQQALELVLQQLLAINPSRAISKEGKALLKGLKDRIGNQQELPQVLQDIAVLQAKILGDGQQNKAGFIQKFLSAGEKTDKSSGAGLADEPYQNEESLNAVVNDEVAHQLKTAVVLIGAGVENKATLRDLQEKLQQGLPVTELPLCLQQLNQLISEAVTSAKNDFSEFLQKTNSQLQSISEILNHATRLAGQQTDEHHQFCVAMGDQLDSLQTTVTQASDLEQLKQTVSGQLDSIRDKLAHSDKKPHSLSEQLKELLGKVEEFEKEAQTTSKILSQQQQKAQTDSLTGLPNRDAYQQRYELELARWQRYKHPLTLAVLDIDHFKRINDTYGHQAGDRVLKLIAQTLRKNLRQTDFIGRYGGEEFVLLLPETSTAQACDVLNNIRKRIADTPFHFRKQPVQITLSAGYSEFAGGDTETSVFARADKALYKSKNNGRNCCNAA